MDAVLDLGTRRIPLEVKAGQTLAGGHRTFAALSVFGRRKPLEGLTVFTRRQSP